MKIILYMIVKNEAHVIERALKSVIPYIDGWAICDTGSTDGTQETIQQIMDKAGIPGKLQQDEWVDFSTNRNKALDLARTLGDKNDYGFLLDADCFAKFDADFKWPKLVNDCYYVKLEEGSTHYRPDIVRLGADWKFFGVVHEYLGPADTSINEKGEILEGFEVHTEYDGARHKDNKSTYLHDAEVIASAMITESNPMMLRRYQFYLAQSYANAGEWHLSTYNYIKRAEMGLGDEEDYLAFMRAGLQSMELPVEAKNDLFKFKEIDTRDLGKGIGVEGYTAEYLLKKAIEVAPDRAEARFYLSCFYSFDERYQEAYDIIKPVLFKRPPLSMMVDVPIYNYGISDQFSSCAYWVGDYKGCIEHCLNLLMLHPELELADRQRIAKNAWKATLKLHELAKITE